MVEAELFGLIPADATGPFPTIDIRNPPPPRQTNFPPIHIRDGRALQANGASEAELFAENGFVLLSHVTAVQDWDDVPVLFCEEIEQIICTRLLPGKGDEVLAFKLSEFWKDEPDAHPQNCFHSAFRDPDAPADAEERQSCEHRVGVLILRD